MTEKLLLRMTWKITISPYSRKLQDQKWQVQLIIYARAMLRSDSNTDLRSPKNTYLNNIEIYSCNVSHRLITFLLFCIGVDSLRPYMFQYYYNICNNMTISIIFRHASQGCTNFNKFYKQLSHSQLFDGRHIITGDAIS